MSERDTLRKFGVKVEDDFDTLTTEEKSDALFEIIANEITPHSLFFYIYYSALIGTPYEIEKEMFNASSEWQLVFVPDEFEVATTYATFIKPINT